MVRKYRRSSEDRSLGEGTCRLNQNFARSCEPPRPAATVLQETALLLLCERWMKVEFELSESAARLVSYEFLGIPRGMEKREFEAEGMGEMIKETR